MRPEWSYALATISVSGLWIAASKRPQMGWWFSIAAQPPWLIYAVVTRQWGFVVATIAHAAAYVRLLCRERKEGAKDRVRS